MPQATGGSAGGSAGGSVGAAIETRYARLERDPDVTRASLERIERLVSVLATDLRDFRREVREQELPKNRVQLTLLEGSLKDKPSGEDFLALALALVQSRNCNVFKAFGMAVGLLVTGARLLAWPHRQGVL